ncbi:hypothetical protein RFI_13818 [Reticulomyxa filosa]|uniref:GPI-anchored wall transfer protein 1 n=1 Tax=Reticulomyxa filosa TaxID=46433 RepID=X6NAR5_RETFI|nr:hypothetical protein RFI_13818 [Reticulomyxa filosa]|eukprot:ETO23365.1 hypothetical protein RFI_13818 [Reticulomyxa filosa]
MNHIHTPLQKMFRGGLMLLTIISILGVDFIIFPRRFAKCETFGFSVMDAGIGLFVIAQGIVSPVVRHQSSATSEHNLPSWRVFVKMFTDVFPFVDYQLHVSEYGVHWNFFFTMCLLSLQSTIVHHFIVFPFQRWYPNKSSHLYLIIAILIGAFYQLLLSTPILSYFYILPSLHSQHSSLSFQYNTLWSSTTSQHYNLRSMAQIHGIHDLTDYILYYPRTSSSSLINLNREGLFSCIGFASIYYLGCWLGVHFHRRRTTKGELFSLMTWLLFTCLAFSACTFVAHNWVQDISRRLCNLTFIFWIVLITNWTIFLSLLSSFLLCFEPLTLLANVINYNQMGIFLFANILTGLINLFLKTLLATPFVAYSIVGCYALICCVVFVVLYQYQIRLKFW